MNAARASRPATAEVPAHFIPLTGPGAKIISAAVAVCGFSSRDSATKALRREAVRLAPAGEAMEIAGAWHADRNAAPRNPRFGGQRFIDILRRHGELRIEQERNGTAETARQAGDRQRERMRATEALKRLVEAAPNGDVRSRVEWVTKVHRGELERLGIHRKSVATLVKWAKSRDGNPDRRGRPRAAQADRDKVCHPDLWAQFLSMMLHHNRFPLTQAHGCIAQLAKERGLPWGSASVVRKYYRDVPEPAKVRYREGPRAFEAKCVPKTPQSYEDVAAGEACALDGRTIDQQIRVPDGRGGWRRSRGVTALVAIDCRSRKMTVVVRPTEHSDGVIAVEKKHFRACGKPDRILVDNGSAFDAATGKDKHFATFHDDLNIARDRSPAYQPWAKGVVESAMRVLKEIDRCCLGYWGGSPDERPERAEKLTKKRVDQLLTLEELQALYDAGLETYHATPHSGDGISGLTPNLAFEQFRDRDRRIDPAVLDVLCARKVGPVKVTARGVRFQNVQYGGTNEAVMLMQGKKVWLLIHPDAADYVTLCDEAGRPICIATSERIRGATRDDVREQMALKARFRKAVRAYAPARDALMESTPTQIVEVKRRRAKSLEAELRKTLPDPPTPEVTIVRPDLVEPCRKVAAQVEKFKASGPAARRRKGFDILAERAAAETPQPPRPRFDWAELGRKASEEWAEERERERQRPSVGDRLAAMFGGSDPGTDAGADRWPDRQGSAQAG